AVHAVICAPPSHAILFPYTTLFRSHQPQDPFHWGSSSYRYIFLGVISISASSAPSEHSPSPVQRSGTPSPSSLRMTSSPGAPPIIRIFESSPAWITRSAATLLFTST